MGKEKGYPLGRNVNKSVVLSANLENYLNDLENSRSVENSKDSFKIDIPYLTEIDPGSTAFSVMTQQERNDFDNQLDYLISQLEEMRNMVVAYANGNAIAVNGSSANKKNVREEILEPFFVVNNACLRWTLSFLKYHLVVFVNLIETDSVAAYENLKISVAYAWRAYSMAVFIGQIKEIANRCTDEAPAIERVRAFVCGIFRAVQDEQIKKDDGYFIYIEKILAPILKIVDGLIRHKTISALRKIELLTSLINLYFSCGKRKEIIQLLKKMDTNINVKSIDEENLAMKVYLLAYSASKFFWCADHIPLMKNQRDKFNCIHAGYYQITIFKECSDIYKFGSNAIKNLIEIIEEIKKLNPKLGELAQEEFVEECPRSERQAENLLTVVVGHLFRIAGEIRDAESTLKKKLAKKMDKISREPVNLNTTLDLEIPKARKFEIAQNDFDSKMQKLLSKACETVVVLESVFREVQTLRSRDEQEAEKQVSQLEDKMVQQYRTMEDRLLKEIERETLEKERNLKRLLEGRTKQQQQIKFKAVTVVKSGTEEKIVEQQEISDSLSRALGNAWRLWVGGCVEQADKQYEEALVLARSTDPFDAVLVYFSRVSANLLDMSRVQSELDIFNKSLTTEISYYDEWLKKSGQELRETHSKYIKEMVPVVRFLLVQFNKVLCNVERDLAAMDQLLAEREKKIPQAKVDFVKETLEELFKKSQKFLESMQNISNNLAQWSDKRKICLRRIDFYGNNVSEQKRPNLITLEIAKVERLSGQKSKMAGNLKKVVETCGNIGKHLRIELRSSLLREPTSISGEFDTDVALSEVLEKTLELEAADWNFDQVQQVLMAVTTIVSKQKNEHAELIIRFSPQLLLLFFFAADLPKPQQKSGALVEQFSELLAPPESKSQFSVLISEKLADEDSSPKFLNYLQWSAIVLGNEFMPKFFVLWPMERKVEVKKKLLNQECQDKDIEISAYAYLRLAIFYSAFSSELEEMKKIEDKEMRAGLTEVLLENVSEAIEKEISDESARQHFRELTLFSRKAADIMLEAQHQALVARNNPAIVTHCN